MILTMKRDLLRGILVSLNIGLLILGVILLNACGTRDQTELSKTELPTYTLIFLDKTQSVNVNKAYVHEKYTHALHNIVEQNMRNLGDKLEVYFIHENTSKARALNVSVRSERESVEGVSATDREANETAFQLGLKREKTLFLNQVLRKLEQTNTGSSNQSTDIWASLPIIAKANDSGMKVKVYYFSDMIESVKGANRRDYHTKPPVSEQEAEDNAKLDYKQLQQYVIGNPEVTIVSPFEPTASLRENNPHIIHYWQTLFEELAGVNIEEL
jgi:hypothetical protein